jgi:hypothetical protein
VCHLDERLGVTPGPDLDDFGNIKNSVRAPAVQSTHYSYSKIIILCILARLRLDDPGFESQQRQDILF